MRDESLLTPWFNGQVKPVRNGVYMLMCGFGRVVGFQMWNGHRWGVWSPTEDGAARSKSHADEKCQNDKWRGLSADPARTKK